MALRELDQHPDRLGSPYILGRKQEPTVIYGFSLWGQIPNRPTSPQLILARLWGEINGEGIAISKKAYHGKELIPGHSTVLATASVAEILDRVCQTPELTVLIKSDNNFISEPNMNRCGWDYNTKQRVSAFRWHRQAEGYTAMADKWLLKDLRIEILWRKMAMVSQARENILLESSQPSTQITPQDLENLIYPVIVREAA